MKFTYSHVYVPLLLSFVKSGSGKIHILNITQFCQEGLMMDTDYEMTPDYKERRDRILNSNWNDEDKSKEFVDVGVKESKKNRRLNAFDSFENATKLDPKNYRAWMYLGDLHEIYGFTVEALNAFAKAAQLPDDKLNNEKAREKYQILRMKETARQGEQILKETKIIHESEYTQRSSPNLSHEDGLANVKRKMGMSIEEREKLNERLEFTAKVFDQLFAHLATGTGQSKIVRMNEEKWHQLVKELISRGRPDAAAENMVYCVRENPANIELWKELLELLDTINDAGMKEAAQEAYQRVLKGEPIEKYVWRRMYAEPPEDRKKGFEKEYLGKVGSGQRLLNSKKFDDAEKVLREALDLDSDRYEANYFLGFILVKQRKYEEAEQYLYIAFNASPESCNAGLILAQLYINKREFEKAYETLVKLRGIPKYSKDAEVFLGWVLTTLGKHEEAIEIYNNLIQTSSDNAEVFEGYGMSLNALGRFEEAEGVLLKAKAIKESASGLITLADVQLQLTKRKAAEDTAKRALKQKEMDISNAIELANILRRLNKVDEAEKLLQNVNTQDPDNIDAQIVLALCYLTKRDYAGALSLSKRLLELNADNYQVWRVYAGSLEVSQRGSDEEIIEAFTKAATLSPENLDAVIELGRYHLKMGRYDEAEKILRDSYQKDPMNIRPVIYLVDTLLKLERGEESLDLAREFMQKQPESADANEILTHVHVENKQWDKALESVNRTLKIVPNHEEGLIHLSEIYLGLDRLKEAEKEIKNVIKLQAEGSGSPYIILARIQRAMGKEKDAEKSEAKAIEIDPGLKQYLNSRG